VGGAGGAEGGANTVAQPLATSASAHASAALRIVTRGADPRGEAFVATMIGPGLTRWTE
jgi:hypothetical protein